MANKRMFSKEVTNSDDFLDMPLGSQALYFHLGMNADDDGFVQPKSIMRLCQAKDDELKILIVKGFLIPFKDSVIVITHWKINNDIKNDRLKPTIYQEYLSLLELNNKMYIKNNDLVTMYPECIQNVSKMDTECIQNGYKMDTQYRLDKIRLDKDSINNNNVNFVIEYFANKPGKTLTKDKNIIKNISQVLKDYSIDDCKKVIDYILSNPWHIQNNQTHLSVIFKPTKFYEKLEKANSYKNIKNNHVLTQDDYTEENANQIFSVPVNQTPNFD